MGMKSSKAQQGATSPIQLRFDGGLNYSQSPSHIQDNELTRALNVVYNSQTGTPESRSGTSCVTAAALSSSILKIYYYEKSPSLKWLVCASGGKLYKLDGDEWDEIGSLTNSTTIPCFITFNTHLLIADGGANIRKWDGTTFSALSDGLYATAIAEIGGRVVINAGNDLDLVTFSGVEDETMWDTADLTNPAIGLRCGFGDNMAVNGFAVFGTDLIVSKKGASAKMMYRITTAGVPTDWTVLALSSNNCAQNAHSIISAFNDVYFMDSDGFKSIKGVTEYGDLQVDQTGAKINVALNGSICSQMVFVPRLSAIWLAVADKVYTASNRGQIVFTSLSFVQSIVTSMVQAGDTVYLAGENGYLYSLNDSSDTDEISPSVFKDYQTNIETKRFSFFGGGILKRTSVEFKALDVAGTNYVSIRANTQEKDNVELKLISIKSTIQELYGANGDLFDADNTLGEMAGSAWIETSTNRVRGTSIQWQINSDAGRWGIEGLQAEIALVMG